MTAFPEGLSTPALLFRGLHGLHRARVSRRDRVRLVVRADRPARPVFELVLRSPTAAKRAVPVLGGVATAGIVLLTRRAPLIPAR